MFYYFQGESESEMNVNVLDDKETVNSITGEVSPKYIDPTPKTENQTNIEEPLAVSIDDVSLEDDLSALNVNDVLRPVSEYEYESAESEEEEDGSDWITPENVKQVKQQMDFGTTEDKEVSVACITTDFAMQVNRQAVFLIPLTCIVIVIIFMLLLINIFLNYPSLCYCLIVSLI